MVLMVNLSEDNDVVWRGEWTVRLYESFGMGEITLTLISRLRVCDAGITAALSARPQIMALSF